MTVSATVRTLCIAAAIASCILPAASARADSCGELWYSRNAVYKAQGYCFHTSRGIRAFGNAGCQYDNVEDVPMSANQRREVGEIVAQERYQGCRD